MQLQFEVTVPSKSTDIVGILGKPIIELMYDLLITLPSV